MFEQLHEPLTRPARVRVFRVLAAVIAIWLTYVLWLSHDRVYIDGGANGPNLVVYDWGFLAYAHAEYPSARTPRIPIASGSLQTHVSPRRLLATGGLTLLAWMLHE